MIKYEIKKNLVYNKGWILIFLIILQLFIGYISKYQNNDTLEARNYLYYHEHLQGKITLDKLDFINTEEKNINGFEEKRELLEEQYKNNEITDKQYIESLEILNTYHYRASVFEDIVEYTNYIQTDVDREFINERNMNSYFEMSIPFLLIVAIILNIVISFQNEESMYLLTNTTLVGRNKLIRTKIVTLIGINSLMFIFYFLMNFLLEYNFNYISELFVKIDSIRMFEGSFFHGNILTMIFILFFMEWIAVIFLSFITSLLYLKVRIGSLKLCILEIGVYAISFFLFVNTKWLYYILPIGFFNPIRYFVDKNMMDVAISMQPFFMKDLIMTIFIALIILIFIFLKRKKIFKMPIILSILILMSACQNQKIQVKDMIYDNINGFNYNEEVSIYTVDNQLIDLDTEKEYQINRDPLKNIETINTGYMYYQFFYYTEIGEDEWSLQRLDTTSFEQTEIYRSSLYKYDILGNITSSARYNMPKQIYVSDGNVYIVFSNRVEVLSSAYDIETLFEQQAFILKIEQEDMYYINDKNQLEVFNMNTHNHKLYLDTLISNAYIDDEYIYYTRLKDETLWRRDRKKHIEEQMIDECVNFFQVVDKKIFYTMIDKKGINAFYYEDNMKEVLLEDYLIYAFFVQDNKIVFTAYDDKSHKILSYYLKDIESN